MPIPVAVVWRRKIVSIAVHIAKQSKRARNFLISVGIRNVLGKLVKRTKHRCPPGGCATQQALSFGLKKQDSWQSWVAQSASSVDAARRETINGRMRMQQQKTRARGRLSSSDYRSERFLWRLPARNDLGSSDRNGAEFDANRFRSASNAKDSLAAKIDDQMCSGPDHDRPCQR